MRRKQVNDKYERCSLSTETGASREGEMYETGFECTSELTLKLKMNVVAFTAPDELPTSDLYTRITQTRCLCTILGVVCVQQLDACNAIYLLTIGNNAVCSRSRSNMDGLA